MLAILAAVVTSLGTICGPTRAEPVAGDDPLPAGALLRLGTARFRHGIPVSMMDISRDGKRAVAVNGNHMLGATRVFDFESGRVLYTLGGWEGTSLEAAAIAPDGQTIVTKQEFSLRVRDARGGKELRRIALPQTKSSYHQNECLKFSPDGKQIVVTSQGAVIHLIDFATGDIIREFANDKPAELVSGSFTEVLSFAFSPDGKRLASGGFNQDRDNYFARLWDVETGKELRRFMHGRSYGIEGVAFSSDGKMLATGAHDARLRLFDVETGREIRTFPPNGKSRMHGGCVAFAPDGKAVAAAGQSLRVYDVASGEERWHVDRRAVGLTFTDGGKTLSGATWGAIYRWDAATGKPLTPEGGDSPVEQIAVAADGRRVVTRGTYGDAHVWDAATGKHLRYVNVAWQHGLAMSADGRFLVWPVEDDKLRFSEPGWPKSIFEGNRLRVYDVEADRFVERFAPFKGDANALAFMPGGKELVTVDHRNGMVRCWDFATGAETRSFQVLHEDERTQANQLLRSELSPDGAMLAVAYVFRPNHRNGGRQFSDFGGDTETYPVRVWNVATGNELFQFDSRERYVNNLAFSPDGKWVVSSGSEFDAVGAGGQLVVFGVQSGKPAATLQVGSCAVAFSDNARYLASATPDGAIRVWEIATWTLRIKFTGGHRDRPTALAFSPNRPLLYSGSLDTTVIGWDLRIPAAQAAGNLETAWNDLALPDAARALKYEGQFIAAREQSVKLFAERVKLSEPADDDAMLRQIRAVEILEQLGDAESKALLTTWTAGPANRPLTAHASAALKRLATAANERR